MIGKRLAERLAAADPASDLADPSAQECRQTIDAIYAQPAPPQRRSAPGNDARALVARASYEGRRPRRQSWRLVALVAVSAAAAVALLAAPASEEDGAPPSGPAVLRAAAAVAADQPPLPASEGYRYTRKLYRMTHYMREDGREATAISENAVESWENAQLEGHSVYGKSRIVSKEGDPVLAERLAEGVPYRRTERIDASVAHGGVGPVPKPADLPTEPEALRRALERQIVTVPHWRKGLPTEAMVLDEIRGMAMWLLTEASSTPQLRAALFRMLAELPGARSVGTVQDSIGRTGEGIAMRGDIEIPSDPPQKMPYESTLVIDPQTAEVLASSGRFLDPRQRSGGMIASETVITKAGQVRAAGERP